MHEAVPLHSLSVHASSAQMMGVPAHVEPEHTSLYVQRSESSQVVDEPHCQAPPTFVQRYVAVLQMVVVHGVCIEALHSMAVPPVQVPFAQFAPHPEQAFPTMRKFGSAQASAHAQEPGVVPHPVRMLQETSQHVSRGPSEQVKELAEQVQAEQVPAPLHRLVQVAG